MTKDHNQFVKELSYKTSETSQKEVVEESIRKELFKIINEFDLENGNSISVNETVELICNKLGMQDFKEKIAEYITQVLQSGKYRYSIDCNGDIKVNFSKVDILQKKYSDERNKRAIERLEEFVQKIEIYASQLSHQKMKITAENLKNSFSADELENNKRWIDLAIAKVLENLNQER